MTHEDEEGVNVIRKIADHIFVVTQHVFLYGVPSFKGSPGLWRRCVDREGGVRGEAGEKASVLLDAARRSSVLPGLPWLSLLLWACRSACRGRARRVSQN